MELVEEKEREARQLRLCYVEQLQNRVAESLAAVRDEQLLRQQLQADFEYNLQLVAERDRELGKYETAVSELRQVVNHLTAESSELKVSLSERESAVEREREQHRERVASLQAQLEQWRRGHVEEVEGERRRCEEVRRELEEKLRDVEGEVERVRSEVTAHFEENIHRTNQQHRTQVEQMESAVFLSQSQVRAKERELEQVQQRQLISQNEIQRLQERVGELERQSKAKEWAWQDRVLEREAELGTVRAELEHTLTSSLATQSQLQHKCDELDRQVREKALCLQMAKEVRARLDRADGMTTWAERETGLEVRVREMEREGERVERERREEREVVIEQLRKKEVVIERLEEEMAEGGERERERERVVAEATDRLHRAREEMNRLQTTLNSVTSNLHRSEEAARRNAERGGVLERECEERVRESERRASARSQTALKMLTQQRDKATSEVHALRTEMAQQQKSIDAVIRERDVAIATLQQHNLYQQYLSSEVKGQGIMSSESCDLPSHEVLSQQNQQLRAVIATMRRELEQLTTGADHGYHGYISHLESELSRVKTENRRLKTEGHRPPSSPAPSGRHPAPSRQLLALTEALVVLQKEKTAVETRVVWLQQTLAAVQGTLREREEEVYQLRAVQVPPQKCQEKLLEATRSILSLLRERDSLLASLTPRPHPQETSLPCHDKIPSHPHPSTGSPPHTPSVPPPHPHTPSAPPPPPHTPSAPPPHPHTSPQAKLPEQNSLSTLLFSDSEVEGQRSLDKLLQVEDILSSSSEKHPPSHHPPAHISPDGNMVAMEMHGQHIKPILRKPYNSKSTRSRISAGGRMGTVT